MLFLIPLFEEAYDKEHASSHSTRQERNSLSSVHSGHASFHSTSNEGTDRPVLHCLLKRSFTAQKAISRVQGRQCGFLLGNFLQHRFDCFLEFGEISFCNSPNSFEVDVRVIVDENISHRCYQLPRNVRMLLLPG